MLRRVPFTIVFLLVQFVANWAAGTLDGVLPEHALVAWGVSGIGLDRGEIDRLATGTFLSHDLSMFLRQLVFAASVIGFFEHRFGTLRAITTFFVIDVFGTVAVLLLVAGPLNGLYIGVDTNQLHDVGMSAGGFGLIGAIAASLRGRWLWLLIGAGALTAKIIWNLDLIADTAHEMTFAIGFAAHIALRPAPLRITNVI